MERVYGCLLRLMPQMSGCRIKKEWPNEWKTNINMTDSTRAPYIRDIHRKTRLRFLAMSWAIEGSGRMCIDIGDPCKQLV